MKDQISLINRIKAPELTTAMLLGILSEYRDPRKKINSLVRNGVIKPVKQGVYIASDKLGLRPFSKEIIANLIYGPSYISLETALSYYGIIPEKVTATTSVCLGRGKLFTTEIGRFQYHHLKDAIYSCGVQLKEIYKDAYCQYACPEKAILDFLYLRETKGTFRQAKEYFEYILDSYRLDLKTIEKLISAKKLKTLSKLYTNQNIHWVVDELIGKSRK